MIPGSTLQPSPVSLLERICFIVEGTAAMFPFWQDIRTHCLDPILKDLDSRTSGASGPSCELALVVCGSASPWSQCPIERSGWTQSLPVFSQWLDAIQPSGGGPVPQPLVAEALAEAVYLLQTAARTSGASAQPDLQQRPAQNRVVLCVASEPSRIYVPWPYPADCKIMDGMASHLELCQALKNHGADFNFVAGQVLGNKVLHQRLMRTFAISHDLRHMTEVKACLVDINPNVTCCMSPKWPEATSAVRAALLQKQTAAVQYGNAAGHMGPQLPVVKPGTPSQAVAQLPEAAAYRHPASGGQYSGAPSSMQAQGQGQKASLGMPPLPMSQSNMRQPSPAAELPALRHRTPIWKGNVLLGEKLSKGHVRLWTCTAVLDSSHPIPPTFGANWPQDLVINKLISRLDLVTLARERQGLQRGFLELSQLEETGKTMAQEMERKKLAGVVDLGTLVGKPTSLIVLTMTGPDPRGIPQIALSPGGEGSLSVVFMIMATGIEHMAAGVL